MKNMNYYSQGWEVGATPVVDGLTPYIAAGTREAVWPMMAPSLDVRVLHNWQAFLKEHPLGRKWSACTILVSSSGVGDMTGVCQQILAEICVLKEAEVPVRSVSLGYVASGATLPAITPDEHWIAGDASFAVHGASYGENGLVVDATILKMREEMARLYEVRVARTVRGSSIDFKALMGTTELSSFSPWQVVQQMRLADRVGVPADMQGEVARLAAFVQPVPSLAFAEGR